MTKLSDLGPPNPGSCPAGMTSQKSGISTHARIVLPVDQRDLRQVFYHEEPGPEPLEPEPRATILQFPER